MKKCRILLFMADLPGGQKLCMALTNEWEIVADNDMWLTQPSLLE